MTTIGIHVSSDKLHGSWHITGTPQPYNVESIRDCICIADDGVSFGEEAWEQREVYPNNTIYGFRNLMSLCPEKDQSDSLHYPFQLAVVDGQLTVSIQLEGTHKLYSIEELFGRLLGKLKKRIEKKLGSQISRAVLAVPSEYFSKERIHSLKRAVELGGLQSVLVISEHHARVIYSGQRLNWSSEKNVVVFEADSAQINLSVMCYSNGNVRPLLTEETTQLSEEAMNRRLAEFCIKEYARKFGTKLVDEETVYQQCVNAASKFVDKTFTVKVEQGRTVQICLNDYLIVRHTMSKDMVTFVEQCLGEVNLTVLDVHFLIHNLGDQLLKALQELLHLTSSKCTLLIDSCTDVHFGLALVAVHLSSASVPSTFVEKPPSDKEIRRPSTGKTIFIDRNHIGTESPDRRGYKNDSEKDNAAQSKRITPSPGNSGVSRVSSHQSTVHSAPETTRSRHSDNEAHENVMNAAASVGTLKTSAGPSKQAIKRLATRKLLVENLFTIKNEVQSGAMRLEAPLSVVTSVRTKCEALLFRFCTSEVMEFEALSSIQDELKRLWNMLTSSSRKLSQGN